MPETSESRLLAYMERMDNRWDRVERAITRLAVLERQDEIDRITLVKIADRVDRLEDSTRALAEVQELRAELSRVRNNLDSEAARITALETDRARVEGMNRGFLVVWTAVTAAPGLVGLAIALWGAPG